MYPFFYLFVSCRVLLRGAEGSPLLGAAFLCLALGVSPGTRALGDRGGLRLYCRCITNITSSYRPSPAAFRATRSFEGTVYTTLVMFPSSNADYDRSASHAVRYSFGVFALAHCHRA